MSLVNTLKFIITHPLNRENKLQSIARFLNWQIGSRLVSGAIVYDWVNGSKFLVKTGETGLTWNVYTGLHEFADMGFFLHVLRREDLFIDVEGYEAPVLEGVEETLKKQTLHSVITELNGSGSRYGYDESRILEMMFDYGFRTYSYNPLGRNLINLKGKNLNSGNTLLIRDEPFILERLKSSPKNFFSWQEILNPTLLRSNSGGNLATLRCRR